VPSVRLSTRSPAVLLSFSVKKSVSKPVCQP
jgi:hypothetical protein